MLPIVIVGGGGLHSTEEVALGLNPGSTEIFSLYCLVYGQY